MGVWLIKTLRWPTTEAPGSVVQNRLSVVRPVDRRLGIAILNAARCDETSGELNR